MTPTVTAGSLTPEQVINLFVGHHIPRTFSEQNGQAMVTVGPIGEGVQTFGPSGKLTPAQLGGPVEAFTVTAEAWEHSIMTAASVAWAASAGNPKARTGTTAAGGTARGLFGLNAVKYPFVADADADDPPTAAMIVVYLTRGLQSWEPFYGSPGLDPNSTAAQVIANARDNMGGYVVDDSLSALDGVLGWADALGKLLSNLLSGQWWRRVGVAALGVLLILLAVVLTIADSTKG